MTWLNEKDAQKYGIQFSLIEAPTVSTLPMNMVGNWCAFPEGYELIPPRVSIERGCKSNDVMKVGRYSIVPEIGGKNCNLTTIQRLSWENSYVITSPCLSDRWKMEIVDGKLTTRSLEDSAQH
jgi:hypothetical protein